MKRLLMVLSVSALLPLSGLASAQDKPAAAPAAKAAPAAPTAAAAKPAEKAKVERTEKAKAAKEKADAAKAEKAEKAEKAKAEKAKAASVELDVSIPTDALGNSIYRGCLEGGGNRRQCACLANRVLKIPEFRSLNDDWGGNGPMPARLQAIASEEVSFCKSAVTGSR
jgi:chemotaxis protein histidine kinase CheA